MQRNLPIILSLVFVAFHLLHASSYIFLCDDAYISFRYVDNFVNGRGFVFNPGEYVEGYSNFLWVIQLTVLEYLKVGVENGALLLGVLYSVGTMIATAALLRLFSEKETWYVLLPFAMLLLAVNSSYAVWTTGGLETRSNTFFIILGLYTALLPWKRYSHPLLLAGLPWAAASLTRPDSLALMIIAFAWFVWANRRCYKIILGYTLPSLIIVLSHFLWRKYYYGEWLPNTYYAKVGEPWWDMGLTYIWSATLEYSLWMLPNAAFAFFIFQNKSAKKLRIIPILALLSFQLVYLARIGGDHFEYRPLDIFWPLSSVIYASSLGVFLDKLPPPRAALSYIATAVFFILATSLIPFMARSTAAPIQQRSEATLRSVPINLEDCPPFNLIPGLSLLTNAWNRATEKTISHAVGVRYFEHRINADFLLRLYTPFEGLRENGLIPEDAVTVMGAVGIVSYFTDLPIIDRYGLTDKAIARNPKTEGKRLMAHNRIPPDGYLTERGVNMLDPYLRDEMPVDLNEYQGWYFVRLNKELILSFRSPDPEWVESAFAGRIIQRP